jgi:hypothetical protein
MESTGQEALVYDRFFLTLFHKVIRSEDSIRYISTKVKEFFHARIEKKGIRF